MQIVYKDKRHSSGMIKNGEMVLYISNRLPASVQQEHIRILTKKLQDRQERARRIGQPALPPWQPSGITDDDSLRARALFWNEKFYGFPMNQVLFRKQESRWGSCSGRTRNVYISNRLKDGPLELLDYVLIHEICHLKEMNHGPRFWALVARACPDYKEKRRLLRLFGEAAIPSPKD